MCTGNYIKALGNKLEQIMVAAKPRERLNVIKYLS